MGDATSLTRSRRSPRSAAAAGLILAISPRAPDLLYDARTALVIAAVGLVNLALAVRPDRGAGA